MHGPAPVACEVRRGAYADACLYLAEPVAPMGPIQGYVQNSIAAMSGLVVNNEK